MNNDRPESPAHNASTDRLVSPLHTADEDLAPLLATARRLKRTLPPVQPSPAFEEELRADLLTTARAQRRATPGPRVVVEPDTWPLPIPLDGTSPALLLSVSLALLALGLTLIHKLTTRQRS
jgi:hypothetical protein